MLLLLVWLVYACDRRVVAAVVVGGDGVGDVNGAVGVVVVVFCGCCYHFCCLCYCYC